MDQLIDIYAKLKFINSLTSDDFEFPKIIIIGEQSTGKSSLLETLVGRSFLPIGPGKFTRCPLEVKISGKDGKEIPDWVEFLNAPECCITNFEIVRQKIEVETNRMVGKNIFSAIPISLKIHSNRLPNICLVDLPGLQTCQSEKDNILLTNITLQYIEKSNSIILLVMSANADPITNESFKLARLTDPIGIRTLVLITKLDLVDLSRKKLKEMINEKFEALYRLDPKNNAGIPEKKYEIIYLKKNNSSVAHKYDILHLISSLVKLLEHYAIYYLPRLKDNISISLRRHRYLLSNFGDPMVDKCRTMLEIVSNFALAYTSFLLGSFRELDTKELTGGARINYIFREIFGNAIRNITPLRSFNKSSLITAIRNASGIKSTIFIPDKCFELLVRSQIKKLERPSLRCVQLVHEEMEELIHDCGVTINSQLQRFPNLRQQVVSVTSDLLRSRAKITNSMVQQLINIHMAYINTGHPDFITLPQKYAPNNQFPQGDINISENHIDKHLDNECMIIEELITKYFNIVKTTIEDTVPKTIMHFLVNYIVENLQSELLGKLFVNGTPDIELMKESKEVYQERSRITDIIQNHEKALDLVHDIQEILKL